jgi:hypothetical protein
LKNGRVSPSVLPRPPRAISRLEAYGIIPNLRYACSPGMLRIPMKPAGDSDLKAATHSDLKAATIPI